MLDVCGIPVVTVEGQPWFCYDVVTTHGSQLSVYFKHTQSMLNPSDHTEVVTRLGDMHVQGYSESQKTQMNLYGVGCEPVAGAKLAVGAEGEEENGTYAILVELIKNVVNIQEVDPVQP